jgi:hypothetical protein
LDADWLDCGGVATVQPMGQRQPRESIVVRGTENKFTDANRLDQIAFAATDVEDMSKRLQSNKAMHSGQRR